MSHCSSRTIRHHQSNRRRGRNTSSVVLLLLEFHGRWCRRSSRYMPTWRLGLWYIREIHVRSVYRRFLDWISGVSLQRFENEEKLASPILMSVSLSWPQRPGLARLEGCFPKMQDGTLLIDCADNWYKTSRASCNCKWDIANAMSGDQDWVEDAFLRED